MSNGIAYRLITWDDSSSRHPLHLLRCRLADQAFVVDSPFPKFPRPPLVSSQTNQTPTQNLSTPINMLCAQAAGGTWWCCRWGPPAVGAAQDAAQAMHTKELFHPSHGTTTARGACDTPETGWHCHCPFKSCPASHALKSLLSKNCSIADHRASSCRVLSLQPSASKSPDWPEIGPPFHLLSITVSGLSSAPSYCGAQAAFVGQRKALEHRRIAARCTVCGHHRIPHQPILSPSSSSNRATGWGVVQLAG